MDKILLKKSINEFKKTGIEPFNKVLTNAVNCVSGEVIAKKYDFIANTTSGVLPSEIYNVSLDKTNLAFDMFEYSLRVVCREFIETYGYEAILNNEVKDAVEVWLYGSPKFFEDKGEKLNEIADKILTKYSCKNLSSKICIAFSQNVLFRENALSEIDGLKKTNFKLAIYDIDDKYSPIMMLNNVKCNYAVLSENAFKDVANLEVASNVTSLTDYLTSGGYKVFANVSNVEHNEILRKCGIYAYWYKGVNTSN